MEIKKAVKSGNSSAVILPRSWLNKEVRVELVRKTNESILLDVLNILKSKIPISSIIGIYLVGSYARNEETKESDIDILVLTENTDLEMIHEGAYSIFAVSRELLVQKLKKDLFPLAQMIRESVPLLNSSYISSIKVNVTNENVKWYLDTTKEKIALIEKSLDLSNNYLDARVAYTLVLRIRTIYIIWNMLKGKDYSKKEFIKKLREISGSNEAYESYLSIKNNTTKRSLNKSEAKKLLEYLKELLAKVKREIR